MAIDWISRIDFTTPLQYRANVNNPVVAGSIPGSLVLECPLPLESIKSNDDFFAGESQEIPIKIVYDSNLINDVMFFQLTETKPAVGLTGITRYTDELDGCIVKIYNKDNTCVFDGILRVDGKGFDTDDFTISFKVFDLMRAYKERSGLPAYKTDGTGTAISFLYMTNAEFAFYISEAFKQFRSATGYDNLNPWSSSPMTLVNNAPKMGIGDFTGQVLYTFNINTTPTDSSIYYGTHPNYTGIQLFYVNLIGGRWYVRAFFIIHPWNINDLTLYYPGSESLEDALSIISGQGYSYTYGNAVAYNGVSYRLEFVGAYPQKVNVVGYTGKWQASNLKILPTATIGQVVKLFLLLCGWKMSIKRNVLTVSQNYYASLSGITAIQPTVSQIRDFRTTTIMPYDKLDSDIYDILDESDTAKAAIKTAVETNYNRYLPKITKETDLGIHSTAGILVPGSFVITPVVPGVPNFPGQTWNRTWFVYEVEQDQDDTDWYNCKAYNIS